MITLRTPIFSCCCQSLSFIVPPESFVGAFNAASLPVTSPLPSSLPLLCAEWRHIAYRCRAAAAAAAAAGGGVRREADGIIPDNGGIKCVAVQCTSFGVERERRRSEQERRALR